MSEPGRTLVVGMSTTEICGVRDHATLLAEELRGRGGEVAMRWLQRREGGIGEEREQVIEYARELRTALGAGSARSARPGAPTGFGGSTGSAKPGGPARPAAVILHYSVFAFSHRGLPLFVGPVTAALRGTDVPVVTIVHEAVYPWTIGGARGKVWALSQRAVLIDVVRSSTALLLTADFRAEWFASRHWLARRPQAVAPVYSNLPAPAPDARSHLDPDAIGLFGYSYEGADGETVLDALARLREGRRPGAHLLLLGAPGPDSAAARAWLEGARARGLEQAVSFSGTLAPQQLSDALARCAALLFIGAGGPSSRKGSLAGSLASGAPVVALDGPRAWEELRDGETIRIVARGAGALADGLAGLLEDEATREAIGARAKRLSENEMGVARTADAVEQLLRGRESDDPAPRAASDRS